MRYLRVLVVDDDPDFLSRTEELLTTARYIVTTADNFEKAGRIVRQARGRIVILSELLVSGHSGLTFLSEILHKYPGIPFSFLSSQPALESVIDALKHGAYDFLRKPVDPDILRHSVARSVERLNLSVETEKQDKDIQDLLEKSRAELKQQRAESELRGFLISMVAHDFRSLFTVLDGYQQLFREKCPRCEDGELAQLHEQVGRTIVRLRVMANTLLDFEEAGKGHLKTEKKPFDMSSILRESVEFYRPYAEQKRVWIGVSDGLVAMTAEGDVVRIGQVLDNLIFNAIKFTPADGKIVVGGNLMDDGNVTAWVRDSGGGIPKGQIERIFDERELAKRKDASSRIGLGLMICRRLINAMDGNIWLESTEGEGTTVFISLPGVR